MERFQKKAILRDLQKRMVFLNGPRQSGKTTLAQTIAKEFSSSFYLNGDRLEDKKIIKEESWHPACELLIFDAIHKIPKWKNTLKSIYDRKPLHQKILVTIDARLETSKASGDALEGRYFLHRLMPLSPAECDKVRVDYTINHFLQRGGFPAPFLAQNENEAILWRLQYIEGLLNIDILDLENILHLKRMRLVLELLRGRVGSPISYTSIAEDAALSVNTVKKYIHILEALFVVFRITPFSKNIARSILKEPKIYFFDTGLVLGDDGPKFENFVATCLMKHIFAKIDYRKENYSLHYIRTKEGKEVDFALVRDHKVEKIIEVKNANHSISPPLHYFHEKYQFPAVQVVKELKREKLSHKIEIMESDHFLKSLEL